jgi:hypothetical protein
MCKKWDPSSLDIVPLRFHSNGREMIYVYPNTKHWSAGWILYQHPDGEWVTLRKATEDDISRLSAAVVAAHHSEEGQHA